MGIAKVEFRCVLGYDIVLDSCSSEEEGEQCGDKPQFPSFSESSAGPPTTSLRPEGAGHFRGVETLMLKVLKKNENPIRTLRDYSKPSHEGCRNTIELPIGNNVVPLNAKESWALLEDLALFDNESWNDPRDFAKLVKAISLLQDVPSTSDHHLIERENQVERLMEDDLAHKQYVNPQNGSFSTYSSSYQTNLEKALSDFDSRQERRLSSLGTQLEQQQDDMINKIKTLWMAVSEKLDDIPTPDSAENSIAHINAVSADHVEKEELRTPKCVYFINSFVILSKESEAKEERIVKPNAAKYKDHKRVVEVKEEVGEESDKEFVKETAEETKKEEENDLEYFDMFPIIGELIFHERMMKNPQPPWDTTNVIDHYLEGMVLRKPFVKETGLVYDKDEGTLKFKNEGEKIIFEMPHKIKMFKHIKKDILKTKNIASFIITGDDGNQKKTRYSHNLKLGPTYRRDKILAPSGGGLILYRAYGNLYAMTALGWLLEEIHVTWAHLEKKRTRLRLYTKSLGEIIIQTVEMASPTLAMAS
nr:MAK10-like protein [Tanacetum cinerariifolium]